jgi:hypothetical protein
MKRKYVSIKVEILTLVQDVVRTSEPSNDPNLDDGYNLSGFTGVLVQ